MVLGWINRLKLFSRMLLVGSLALATATPASPAAVSGSATATLAKSTFKFDPPKLSYQDSLFIVAATGEPRFKLERDAAQKKLIASDTSTLNYILAHRLIDQTPRQRHYVETLFKSISDSGRNHASVKTLAEALPRAPDSVQPQLLRIGSELGDSTFLPIAFKYLRHDSLETRKNAVRSLGTYPSPTHVPLLFDGLAKTRDLELQQRLWALSKQQPLKDWVLLLPFLKDENLYNRQLVRHIVVKAIGGDWSLLELSIPKEKDEREELEWMLFALETPGPAPKAYVRKTLPLLEPDQRKFIESMMYRGGIGERLRSMGPNGPAGPAGPSGTTKSPVVKPVPGK